jgi:hypothetical protein
VAAEGHVGRSEQHAPLALNDHPGSTDSVNPSVELRRSCTVTSTVVPLGPGKSDTSRENSAPRSTPDQWVLGFFCEGGRLAAAEAAEAGEASASLGASAWHCCKELQRSLCTATLQAQRLARFAVGGLASHGLLRHGALSMTGWAA